MAWFKNYYKQCTEWNDECDCKCNDECPVRKAEIESAMGFLSEEIEETDEQ